MLDIHIRGRPPRALAPIEFLRISLTPLADGRVLVCMTATSFDDEDAQLLDQEVATSTVATIDDVTRLIKAHVAFVNRNRSREH